MSTSTVSVAPAAKPKWPKSIPYIVGNEAAERFSFYGMRAILQVYLTYLFLDFAPKATVAAGAFEHAERHATEVYHLFVAGVYAFPMLGALLADRLFGKYRVIMWLSLVYCAGHGVLALAGHTEFGVYTGLALIAIGSGGIKPCVSANVGDQFDSSNQSLVERIYQIFYFAINFGSFFSTLLIPFLLGDFPNKDGNAPWWQGPDIAFGVPGILMFIATVIFWLGRNKFKRVPPSPGGVLGALDALASIFLFVPLGIFLFGDVLPGWLQIVASIAGFALWLVLFSIRQARKQDTGFLAVILYSVRNQHRRKPGMGFFDVAREELGQDAAEGPPSIFRISLVFSMISVFWALFDQHGSSWVRQADRMLLDVSVPFIGMVHLKASQISAMNPIMVMALLPVVGGLSVLLRKAGVNVTPLRKMTVGMFIASSSFAAVALLQREIEMSPPNSINVLYQVVPYLLITSAEVLVSVTGLEFAYTQAPRAMKSTIMGLFLLTVTFGNKLVAYLATFEGLPLVSFFWVFSGLMAVAAVVFMIIAIFYKGKTYMQDDPGIASGEKDELKKVFE